tara:strand:+ start:153 stop:422 length:270 start_codon:yes stop_codon:yes gene_type:complete
MNILQKIIENNPESEFLIADGYDDAVIGYCYQTDRLIYSYKECIAIDLCEVTDTDQAPCYFDVVENLEYNVLGSYVGENTPIWCMDEDI